MISEMEQARHAQEKGAILVVLKDSYGEEMTRVAQLAGALVLAGRGMTVSGLQFALTYLADSGYVKIWRVREVPGYRTDRPMEARPETIAFVRLLPKGLQLIDGLIAEDPSVAF